MLRNPNSVGTSLTVEQLAMPPEVAGIWRKHATRPVYEEYRVAVVNTKDFPILICFCQL